MDCLLKTAPPPTLAVSGFVYALIAYGLWGAFPLYFALLDSVSPVEIVAHRVIWSLVFLLGIVAVTRGWASVRDVFHSRRSMVLLSFAAIAVTINWTTYVYAVSINQVVESSLGYFINPLVSVALGVLILSDRLRTGQWIAVGIATAGVVVIGVGAGTVPFIGLVLAGSFGMYGLLKKMAGVGAISSLTIETMLLFPFAAAVLAISEIQGHAAFILGGLSISILLILLGPVTAIPLLAFVGAANRLPLSILGIMQYLTPTVLFLLGITIFGQTVTPVEWIGYLTIWAALALFSFDTIRHSARPTKSDALDVTEPT